MALFNIKNARIDDAPPQLRDYKTSNVNIRVGVTSLTVSKLQITEQEWLGN